MQGAVKVTDHSENAAQETDAAHSLHVKGTKSRQLLHPWPALLSLQIGAGCALVHDEQFGIVGVLVPRCKRADKFNCVREA